MPRRPCCRRERERLVRLIFEGGFGVVSFVVYGLGLGVVFFFLLCCRDSERRWGERELTSAQLESAIAFFWLTTSTSGRLSARFAFAVKMVTVADIGISFFFLISVSLLHKTLQASSARSYNPLSYNVQEK